MKKFMFYLFLAYIALSVQAVFFRGPKPDFVLILVCFYSLRYGQIKGVAYGALSGLLIDTASGFIIGPHIISKSLAGFIARTLKGKVFQWNVFINTLLIAVFSIIDIFLVHLCLESFSKISFINMPWKIPIIQIMYTIAASLVMYSFLHPEKDSAVTDE